MYKHTLHHVQRFLRYMQTPFTLCAKNYYVLYKSKHLLHYVQTPITLRSNSFYVNDQSVLCYVQTPIKLW